MQANFHVSDKFTKYDLTSNVGYIDMSTQSGDASYRYCVFRAFIRTGDIPCYLNVYEPNGKRVTRQYIPACANKEDDVKQYPARGTFVIVDTGAATGSKVGQWKIETESEMLILPDFGQAGSVPYTMGPTNYPHMLDYQPDNAAYILHLDTEYADHSDEAYSMDMFYSRVAMSVDDLNSTVSQYYKTNHNIKTNRLYVAYPTQDEYDTYKLVRNSFGKLTNYRTISNGSRNTASSCTPKLGIFGRWNRLPVYVMSFYDTKEIPYSDQNVGMAIHTLIKTKYCIDGYTIDPNGSGPIGYYPGAMISPSVNAYITVDEIDPNITYKNGITVNVRNSSGTAKDVDVLAKIQIFIKPIAKTRADRSNTTYLPLWIKFENKKDLHKVYWDGWSRITVYTSFRASTSAFPHTIPKPKVTVAMEDYQLESTPSTSPELTVTSILCEDIKIFASGQLPNEIPISFPGENETRLIPLGWKQYLDDSTLGDVSFRSHGIFGLVKFIDRSPSSIVSFNEAFASSIIELVAGQKHPILSTKNVTATNILFDASAWDAIKNRPVEDQMASVGFKFITSCNIRKSFTPFPPTYYTYAHVSTPGRPIRKVYLNELGQEDYRVNFEQFGYVGEETGSPEFHGDTKLTVESTDTVTVQISNTDTSEYLFVRLYVEVEAADLSEDVMMHLNKQVTPKVATVTNPSLQIGLTQVSGNPMRIPQSGANKFLLLIDFEPPYDTPVKYKLNLTSSISIQSYTIRDVDIYSMDGRNVVLKKNPEYVELGPGMCKSYEKYWMDDKEKFKVISKNSGISIIDGAPSQKRFSYGIIKLVDNKGTQVAEYRSSCLIHVTERYVVAKEYSTGYDFPDDPPQTGLGDMWTAKSAGSQHPLIYNYPWLLHFYQLKYDKAELIQEIKEKTNSKYLLLASQDLTVTGRDNPILSRFENEAVTKIVVVPATPPPPPPVKPDVSSKIISNDTVEAATSEKVKDARMRLYVQVDIIALPGTTPSESELDDMFHINQYFVPTVGHQSSQILEKSWCLKNPIRETWAYQPTTTFLHIVECNLQSNDSDIYKLTFKLSQLSDVISIAGYKIIDVDVYSKTDSNFPPKSPNFVEVGPGTTLRETSCWNSETSKFRIVSKKGNQKIEDGETSKYSGSGGRVVLKLGDGSIVGEIPAPKATVTRRRRYFRNKEWQDGISDLGNRATIVPADVPSTPLGDMWSAKDPSSNQLQIYDFPWLTEFDQFLFNFKELSNDVRTATNGHYELGLGQRLLITRADSEVGLGSEDLAQFAKTEVRVFPVEPPKPNTSVSVSFNLLQGWVLDSSSLTEEIKSKYPSAEVSGSGEKSITIKLPADSNLQISDVFAPTPDELNAHSSFRYWRRTKGAASPEIVRQGDTITFSKSYDGSQYTMVADVPTYTVTFLDDVGGDIVKRYTGVEYGTGVTPPPDPVKEGAKFRGWSGEYSHITGDTTIVALWEVAYVWRMSSEHVWVPYYIKEDE